MLLQNNVTQAKVKGPIHIITNYKKYWMKRLKKDLTERKVRLLQFVVIRQKIYNNKQIFIFSKYKLKR